MIVVCTGASGVFPIAATLGGDVQSALRDRGASTTRRLTALRRALLVTQIAFACILVYGATLMIATVRKAQRVTLGFRPSGLVVFNLSLPRETYPRPTDVAATYTTLVEKLRAIPGVSNVALASNVPLDADHDAVMVGVEGRPFKADGTDPNVDQRVISAGYFDVMGISRARRSRLPRGRRLSRRHSRGDQQGHGAPALAGRRRSTRPPSAHRTVRAVDDDRRRGERCEEPIPHAAEPRRDVFAVRGAEESGGRVARNDVRGAGSGLVGRRTDRGATNRAASESRLAVVQIRRYEDVVARSQIREVATMRTLAAFAAIALALAIAGSYAMLMFAVVQRSRELALRQAVGATARDLGG